MLAHRAKKPRELDEEEEEYGYDDEPRYRKAFLNGNPIWRGIIRGLEANPISDDGLYDCSIE